MQVIPASTDGIARALEVLQSGGCVVHATETCYGIACDLGNPDAVKHLFEMKQRPVHQPVSALFSSMEEAEKYVVFSPLARELVRKYLPGPLTLVLPVQLKTPTPIFVTADSEMPATIGVRISSHPVAQALVEGFGRPIATTSANLHGKPSPYSVAEIKAQWDLVAPTPKLIIDSGFLAIAEPSTVVQIERDCVTTLRQGTLHIS